MKVWLFDIDGTLIVSRGAGQEATWAAMRVAFGVEPREGEIRFAGRTDRAIAADLFRLHDVPITQENWWRFRAAYLQELNRCLPGREGQILPGVRDLLTRLLGRSTAHLVRVVPSFRH